MTPSTLRAQAPWAVCVAVGLLPAVTLFESPGPRTSVIGADGPIVVTETLRLEGDRTYRLKAPIDIVAGELILEPGVRVEADPGTAIVVRRGGRIIADGTSTLPVVLTCFGTPQPGCWSGLVVKGFATVNDGSATSPVDPVRDPVGGCRELFLPTGGYGGCVDADSSGVLRNVWIEYAGEGGSAGLSLQGVGSGTPVENVQVFRSAGTGVDIRGGAVDFRFLRLAFADSVAMSWDQGWRGRLQYGIVQARPGARAALEGSNLRSNPDASPRSAPTLRNVSIVGPPVAEANATEAAVRLGFGTAGVFESFFISRQPAPSGWLLDVDGVSSWAQVTSGALRFESSHFVGFAPLGQPDADPVDPLTSGLFSPDAEGQLLRRPASTNRLVVDFDSLDLHLKAPYGPLQDLRPRNDGLLIGATCSSSSGDAFFDPVSFCGALDNGSFENVIPWNEPGPSEPNALTPPAQPNGYLFVVVSSPARGPLGGVSLVGSGIEATSGSDGFADLYVEAGFRTYSVANLPPGCADPGLFFVDVPPNGTIGQSVVVSCSPAPPPSMLPGAPR